MYNILHTKTQAGFEPTNRGANRATTNCANGLNKRFPPSNNVLTTT